MKLLTELFDYQRAAVEKLSRVKVGALYMEMGTGKTRTALELFFRRLESGKVQQALWLCPYSCQNDLPELLSEHAEGFESKIRICGIESLSNSDRINQELLNYVASAPTYLIVDESLLVKNPAAYRTRNITRIAEYCPYRLILNGTPISKNEGDLFSQWYILDWRILGYRSFYSFQANHLEYDPERPDRVVRVLNKDYLSRKIAPYTFEVRKDDVLEIPNKVYDITFYWMTEEQQKHYDYVAQDLIDRIDEKEPATIYRLFGALQSISSGFYVHLGRRLTREPMFKNPADNPRIQTLLRLLDATEQTVIYCKYTQEIFDIIAVLNARTPGCAVPFYGEMTRKQRQHNKTLFKSGQAQYLIANKSCAQFGLNLQFCCREVFYSCDWDYGTRVQAEDRLHRVGQTREVMIFDIVAQGTLDMTIQQCLSNKETLLEQFKRAVQQHNSTTETLISLVHGQVLKDV